MDSMFERINESYNLRNLQEFLMDRKQTVHYGLETLSCRFPQLWSLLPENIKEVGSVTVVHVDYVNLFCRILDFFNHFCCYL